MISVRTPVEGKHYDVLIDSGLLANTGEVVRQRLSGATCAIIADTIVAPLFAGAVRKSLGSADFKPVLITIPAGEKSKTL
ncbi:MAG: 3-dehydroquinate synthase, partial [Verrucomicrobia bacterium]|nr:3-dehydroquinate synthase [Verrucomicrobiota bacterium]